MIEVELTLEELIRAANVGVRRQAVNVEKQRRDQHGVSYDEGWKTHISGAIGECAFAKAIDVFWSGALKFRAQDVGPWEVRTARGEGRLILHPKDKDESKFVLVQRLTWLRYRVVGWIYAKDGKQPGWWENPTGEHGRTAFFVPIEALQEVIA